MPTKAKLKATIEKKDRLLKDRIYRIEQVNAELDALQETDRQFRSKIDELENDVDILGVKIFLRDKHIATLTVLLKIRDERISRLTPEFLKSPYCATHESIAARQQVKGNNGAYVWMEYCNYQTREECDVA